MNALIVQQTAPPPSRVMTTHCRSNAIVAASFGATLGVLSSNAHAQTAPPSTSSLNWVRLPGAESCITARALAEAVERRLQRTVFVSSSAGDLAIEGRIERASDQWTATVTITRADGTSLGTRTLSSRDPSCRAIDASVELVLVLAIDPDALQRAPSQPEPPRPSQQPAPEVRTIETVRVVERTVVRPVIRVERIAVAPPTPWRFGFALGGGVNVGLTPNVAPMAWGAAEVTPPRFVAIELSGGGGASIASTTNQVVGVSVDAAFAFGGVAICPRATIAERVRVGGCVGTQLGPLRWSSDGATGRRTSDFFLATATARGTAAVIVRRPFELQLDAGAVVPFVRPKFVVGTVTPSGAIEPQTVFEASPIAAQITLSAVVRFSP